MATLRSKFKSKNVDTDAVVLPLDNRPTAGEQLRNARQQQGRELDDLYPELGLSRTSLERLEHNQFDLFPEGPYVRGYLKNYCAVLGIDPAPVLDSYARLSGEWEREQAAVSQQAAERQKRQARFKGASVLLAVILALFLLWLAQPKQDGVGGFFEQPLESTSSEHDSQ